MARTSSKKTSRSGTKRQERARRAHSIHSISIVGGFLDGARFDLAGGLNCFIGGRGTGKTTVLELVRYALDALPTAAAERRRIESLVAGNLAGGRVQLAIETKDGLSYIISRAAGEEPMVLTGDGKPTAISRSNGVFQADIFSQNEVEGVADRIDAQLALIDNFASEALSEVEADIRKVRSQLDENAIQIGGQQSKHAGLSEEVSALPEIEEGLKAFASDDPEDSDPINQEHSSKALRDREATAVKDLQEHFQECSDGLGAWVGELAQQVRACFDEEMLDGPNGARFKEVVAALDERSQRVNRFLLKARDEVVEACKELTEFSAALGRVHDEQELAFRKLIEGRREAQKQAVERTKLEKSRNTLLAKKREHTQLGKTLDKLYSVRENLLRQLSEWQDKRYEVRSQVVEGINKKLANVRVRVAQYGDRTGFKRLLEECLKGSKLKYGRATEKLSSVWPVDLVAAIKANDIELLVDKAELSHDQAEKIVQALRASTELFKLETVELGDLPSIELKDGDEYKALSVLSTGQKCTAVLPILLLESARPLLVDQPEDNLDNSFIYEAIVSNLRTLKSHRQIVFVTHNPNIPVLAEAWVFVLDSDGTCGKLANEGSVEDCKEEIIRLLEGGREAFQRRQQRYGS